MTPTDEEAAVLDYLEANPGAHAVEMLCSGVLPHAQGTLWYFPVLDRLAAGGLIVNAPASAWAEHVQMFPGAHTVCAPLVARQSARWFVSAAAEMTRTNVA